MAGVDNVVSNRDPNNYNVHMTLITKMTKKEYICMRPISEMPTP